MTTTAPASVARRTTAPPRRTRRSAVAVLVSLVAYLVVWEVVSRLVARSVDHPEFVMPGLGSAITDGLPRVGEYYGGMFGGTPPSRGGQTSSVTGLLALLEHSLLSLGRFAGGLALGVTLGVVVGVSMVTRRELRLGLQGLANLLRMLPILAMGPLFTLWFGARSTASIVFIAFATAPIVLIATMSAVRHLDQDTTDYARTLGASPSVLRRRVVLPALVPGIAGSIGVVGVLAWSVLLASELYGIQDGVGWMMGQALEFTQMPAVMIIGAAFIALAFATATVLGWITARLTRWAE